MCSSDQREAPDHRSIQSVISKKLLLSANKLLMTNAEMHAIQVHNSPVLLQGVLTLRFKLLSKSLVEAADRAGTGSHTH